MTTNFYFWKQKIPELFVSFDSFLNALIYRFILTHELFIDFDIVKNIIFGKHHIDVLLLQQGHHTFINLINDFLFIILFNLFFKRGALFIFIQNRNFKIQWCQFQRTLLDLKYFNEFVQFLLGISFIWTWKQCFCPKIKVQFIDIVNLSLTHNSQQILINLFVTVSVFNLQCPDWICQSTNCFY